MSSLTEAVGAFLAATRQEHGLTLDKIATEARDVGLTWTTSSVRNFESGRFALTIQNLVSIAFVLGRLTGQRFRLSDLFSRATDLGEGFPQGLPVEDIGYISRKWLDDVLAGGEIWLDVGSHTRGRTFQAEVLRTVQAEVLRTVQEAVADMPDEWDWEAFSEATKREPTLAERRAGAKLGESARDISIWAQHLWGHALDDEAAIRAGAGASPQRRGYVTRGLVREIAEAIERNQSGDD